MSSRTLIRAFDPIARASASLQARTLSSTVVRKMPEGDAGAPRSGGAAAGDAFTKREQASEDFYVKQQERDKLKALKEKIAQQQKHLKDLEDHVNEMSK